MKFDKFWFCLVLILTNVVSQTDIPTFVPSMMPSITPTLLPTMVPSVTPSFTPSHTSPPSFIPSFLPSVSPTFIPSIVPTQPTGNPSMQPSGQPSRQPSGQPSRQPSSKPTNQPQSSPSSHPSSQPVMRPSSQPVGQPSSQPTLQPFLKPTSFPSQQPSGHPTQQPFLKPTSKPSEQPVSHPTQQPSAQPSSQPSRQPVLRPTSRPISTPSSQPSKQPYARPSSRPSTQPYARPSTQPTSQPSVQPSSYPSRQPTSRPSTEPSQQPFHKPSGIPTHQPSSQPSAVPLRPSSKPSGQPTCLPHMPTSMPSRQPSSQPTTKPSGLPQCPAGMMYVFQGDGVFTCDPCPGGQISGENSNHCTACPAGQQPLNGVECTLCPVGTYANKASTAVCTVCGANQVTPIGATSVNQCVNPLTNFIFGFFCLFFCGIAFSHYIGGGRLQRIAFIRKEMLIKQGQIMFHVLCDKIDFIGRACNDQNRREQMGKNQNTVFRRFVKPVLFFLAAFALVVFVTFYFLFNSLLHVFFNALILWRGYSFSFSFAHRIERYLDVLSVSFHIPSYMMYVFYPFLFVVRNVASLKINLTAVNVSCPGAQAPIKLLLDCIVVGVVVIIIESDMEVFWQTQLNEAVGKYRSLLFNRYYFMTNHTYDSLKYFVWACGLSVLPSPRKWLQYALGLVAISAFFETNAHAASSTDCDNTSSLPLDTILAYSATILLYLLVLPILYMLSQILVPSFQLGDDSSDNRASLAPMDFDDSFKARAGDGEEEDGDVELTGPSASQKSEEGMSGRSTTPLTKQKSIFNRKKNIKQRHRLASALRVMALFSSVDWFYMKVMFRFAESLYLRLLNFNLPLIIQTRERKKSRLTSFHIAPIPVESVKTTSDLPSIPWFYALHVIYSAEQDDSVELKRQWHERSSEIPSYYRMVKTVYQDFMSTEGQTRLEDFAVEETNLLTYVLGRLTWVMSWTIFAQLYSKRGRNIWWRVLVNYVVLLQATLGIWSASSVYNFGLMRKMDEFDEIEELAERRVRETEAKEEANRQRAESMVSDEFTSTYGSSKKKHSASISSKSRKSKVSTRSGGLQGALLTGESEESQRLNTFAALIAARVVLLQLVPFFTLISTLAVDISSSPVLITSKVLSDKLPGLLILDAYSDAKKRLQAESRDERPPIWQVYFLAAYIFVHDSRLIQCALNIVLNTFSFIVIFLNDSQSSVSYGLYLFVGIFTVVGLIQAGYVILLLYKLMFPAPHHLEDDEEQEEDGERDVENGTSFDKDEDEGGDADCEREPEPEFAPVNGRRQSAQRPSLAVAVPIADSQDVIRRPSYAAPIRSSIAGVRTDSPLSPPVARTKKQVTHNHSTVEYDTTDTGAKHNTSNPITRKNESAGDDANNTQVKRTVGSPRTATNKTTTSFSGTKKRSSTVDTVPSSRSNSKDAGDQDNGKGIELSDVYTANSKSSCPSVKSKKKLSVIGSMIEVASSPASKSSPNNNAQSPPPPPPPPGAPKTTHAPTNSDFVVESPLKKKAAKKVVRF